MNVRVFIILMVIHAITCEKAVSKLRRKLIVPKMSEKCKKIKCASVDDPVCVRMRRHDMSLTTHIIASNQCELEFIKCHDDVEAKIVPMKYCSHNVDQIEGKKKNKPGKAHIRVKRRVKAVYQPILRQDVTESSTTEEPRKSTWMPFGPPNHPIKDPWKSDMWDKVPPELYIYLVM